MLLIVSIKDGALPIITFHGVDARPYDWGKTIAGEGRAEITSSITGDFKGFVFPRRRRLGFSGKGRNERTREGMSGMKSGGYAMGNTQRGNHADSIRLAISSHLRKRENGQNTLHVTFG